MSSTSQIAVVDFETEAIEVGYNYPPKPVGVAIDYPDGSRHYFAFGHPTGNNCDENDARSYLRGVYDRYEVLFHHAQFDLHVARKHWALWPTRGYHCTMILVCLDAPHAKSFGLKESAERILGIKPEERDKLRDWIVENVPEAKRKKKNWGAWISKAPGDLVAPYAKDDVRLPRLLFEQLYDRVRANGMAG